MFRDQADPTFKEFLVVDLKPWPCVPNSESRLYTMKGRFPLFKSLCSILDMSFREVTVVRSPAAGRQEAG